MTFHSKAGVPIKGPIIPANVKKEKEVALCADSPTGVHFFLLRYDDYGKLVSNTGKLACESCGKPIRQQGARWVLDLIVIKEEDDIEDLL